MMEFVSINWLGPLVKKLASLRGERAQELARIGDVFGDPKVLARYYVEPKCQHHNPADHHEDLAPVADIRAPVFQVINEFLSGDPFSGGGRTQLFVLADAGMGKTSLLMMLRLGHLTAFWPKGYDCLLLKLGEDTLEAVERHQDKSRTVLLLDALDEDPMGWGNIRDRLLAVLQATENSRRVVVTCRTQFFPETGVDPFGNPGRVELGGYICPMWFLSLFDDEQVDAYLNKRFPVRAFDPRTYGNRARRATAQAVLGSMHSFRFRPLLLRYVEDLLEAEPREWNEFTVTEALVDVWLGREERKLRRQLADPPDKKVLWSLCARIAADMQGRGVRTLSRDALKRLVADEPALAHLDRFDPGGRSLLNRNSDGEFRFAHYPIQEFLLLHDILRADPPEPGAKRLRATDQVLKYLTRAVHGSFATFELLDRLDLGELAGRPWPDLSLRDALANGGYGPAMRFIPEGEFWMGSGEGGYDDERPRHRVRIGKPFAMGVYPVTFEEYDRFCEATGRDKPDDRGWGRGRRPVIHVSWDDAQAYCEWLSEQAGARYRLPSEAEWEYAVRAGTETIDWWGDDEAGLAQHVWFSGNSGRKTHEVGQKPANPWGIHDALGNVFEWVQDCYQESYEGAPEDGSAWEPHDPEGCAARVLRGGSWGGGATDVRSANRARYAPASRNNDLGFRLARSL